MPSFNVSYYNKSTDYIELKEKLEADFPDAIPQAIEVFLFNHFRKKWLQSLSPKEKKEYHKQMKKIKPIDRTVGEVKEVKIYHDKEQYDEDFKHIKDIIPEEYGIKLIEEEKTE